MQKNLLKSWVVGIAVVVLAGCETTVEPEEEPAEDNTSTAPQFLEVMETFPGDHDSEVAEDAVISVKFNNEMDVKTVNSATILLMGQGQKTVPSEVKYDAKTKTATLSPLTPLSFNADYVGHVTHRVRDTAGRHVSGAYQWQFTVRARPMSLHLVTQPADAAVDVNVKTRVVIELHAPVDVDAFDPAAFTLADANGAGVAGVVSLVSAPEGVLIFAPEAELAPATTYTATVAKGVPLKTGEALDENVTWSFTTAAARTVTMQYGDAPVDRANAVAVDADGNIFLAGVTSYTGADGGDISEWVVTKASADGVRMWLKQIPIADGGAVAHSAAVDGAGNVVVAGVVTGAVEGGTSAGATDVLIVKLDGSNGDVAWATQFGTDKDDAAFGIALNTAGDSYVVGATQGVLTGQTSAGRVDGFIALLDVDGNMVWATQYGSSDNDFINGVSIDPAGNVFAAGNTAGSIGTGTNAGFDDIFVSQIDPADGAVLATRLIGTAQVDYAAAITATASGVYVAGSTYGTLGATAFGFEDAVLIALSTDITAAPTWIEQFGGEGFDIVNALASDGADTLALSGTRFDFGSGARAFVQRFDAVSQAVTWSALVEDVATPPEVMSVVGLGVAFDTVSGNVHAAGYTLGSIDGNAVVGEDAYLVSFDVDGAPR